MTCRMDPWPDDSTGAYYTVKIEICIFIKTRTVFSSEILLFSISRNKYVAAGKDVTSTGVQKTSKTVPWKLNSTKHYQNKQQKISF